MTTLTPEQRRAIEQEGHVRIEDGAYVVLKAEDYDRLRSLIDADWDDADFAREMLPHAMEVFGRDGWDDPIMDEYNDLDPRRGS